MKRFFRFSSIRAFGAAIFFILFLCGCSTIETRNYAETEDVLRVVRRTPGTGSELHEKSLVIFCSESPGIRFEITKPDNKQDRAVAVVGKEAFAAFAMTPGVYTLNDRRNFSVRKRRFNFFELTPDQIRPISADFFLDKYSGAYLPVTLDSTLEGVEPSPRVIEPTTPGIQKIGWYTGKSLYWIVAAPCYTVYYTVRTVLWFVVLRFAGVSKGDILVDSKGEIVDWGKTLPVQSTKNVLDTASPGRVKVL